MKIAFGILLIALTVLASACMQEVAPTPAPSAVQQIVQEASEPSETASVKEFDVVAKSWVWVPSTITVNEGDTVKLHVKSVDVPHGIRIAEFGINEYLAPGADVDIEFVADKKGSYTFYCNVQCGEGHKGMKGTFIVE